MTTSAGKALGQVKWFNNKSGFGFITVMNGDHSGKDIFVHHSDLLVDEEQYRYLVTGEYVEFKLSELSDDNMKDKDDKHKFKASEVKGVCSGTLMCEVRKNLREEHTEQHERHGTRPDLNTKDEQTNKDWMVVRRKNQKSSTYSGASR